MKEKMIFKGQIIEPYESFYWKQTPRFFKGTMGGGMSRCVTTLDNLAVMVEDEGLQDVSVSERGE